MNQNLDTAIISHLYKDDNGQWNIQDNEIHSKGVAELAQRFASKFGMSMFGYIAGMLHDLGKERDVFQQYIRAVNGIEGYTVPAEHRHAYVGALAALKLYPNAIKELLAVVISAHHRGLYDMCGQEFKKLIEEAFPNKMSLPAPQYEQELNDELHPYLKDGDLLGRQMGIRMLFSCLVDADYMDTDAFMNQRAINKEYLSLEQLNDILTKYIHHLESTSHPSEINEIRHSILENCLSKSLQPRGVYSLSVPTGGGKTISSMVWAVSHAIKHGMDRIIVAIPFTSIIQQTANIFREIFGDENVIEHHSLAEVDNDTNKLCVTNWDAPIVVTTNVQLFESLYSHKPSKCRKLHNIANSVIILDEAQALPVSMLNPIVKSLDILTKSFGCSVLLSTATQPALGGIHTGTLRTTIFTGFKRVTEIIPDVKALFSKMKRTEVTEIPENLSYDEIANEILKHPKVLCIVNTRKDAYEIYRRLSGSTNTFHLSKNMYASHIQSHLTDIKNMLKDSQCETLRLISTQLIEAGVDIDFPVVLRQEAGLDSIIQAAGRCNREGKHKVGVVKVFKIKDRNPCPGLMTKGNSARKALSNPADIHNPAVISQYYENLYSRCTSFDTIKIKELGTTIEHQTCKLLLDGGHFETVGKNFRLIDDNSRSIIIACHAPEHLISMIKNDCISKTLLQQLSAYTVSIPEYTYKKLLKDGCIEELSNGHALMENSLYYEDTGLKVNDEIIEDLFII